MNSEELAEFCRRWEFGNTGFTCLKNRELYGGRRGAAPFPAIATSVHIPEILPTARSEA